MKDKHRDMLRDHFLIVIIAAVFIISGCAMSLLYPRTPKSYNIIYITKSLETFAFWNTVRLGMDVAAKDTNSVIDIRGIEREDDFNGQNKLIERAILDKPDAIILTAADYDRQEELCRKIVSAGIKLITVDSDINSDAKSAFIGTDNYDAGVKTGKALSARIGDDGKIAVISFVKNSKPGVDREQGFLDGLTEAQRQNIIGPYYCNSILLNSYEMTKQILDEQPDIDAIVGLNEPSFRGVVMAVKEVAFNRPISIAGIDSSSDSIEAMEEGLVGAITVQNPFNMGYLAVTTTVDIINGKPSPGFVDTGAHLITKDSMYEPENQKLLFIFAEE